MMKHLTLLIKPAGGLCNMRCEYCFYAETVEERGDYGGGLMLPDVTDAMIKSAMSFAGESVSFMFQGGEPLIAGKRYFREFIERVNAENKQGLRVNYSLQTNGMLIDNEWAAFFKENNFLLGVSLDGPPDIHDENRRTAAGGGTHSKVMAAVRILDAHKVDYNILCVVSRNVARYGLKTYNFYKKNGFKFIQFIPCLDGAAGSKRFSLTDESFNSFLENVFDAWYADYMNGEYISIRHFDNYVRMLCGYPPENCAMSGKCGQYFVVEKDGKVYPCDFYCLPAYCLGNILESGFDELLRSQKMTDFQTERPAGSGCAGCKHYMLCRGGCKRERDGDGYRFCAGLYKFLEYAYPRLCRVAEMQKR